MIKSRRRIIIALVAIALIGLAGYMVVSAMRREPPGNLATGAIISFEIEIRATSASPDQPVHIDTYDCSAYVHFGDDTVQVNAFFVTLPGGLQASVPSGCKVMEFKETKQGIRVWFDGVEIQPGISEAAKKAKEADLKAFDKLRDDLENADLFELLSLDPNSGKMLGKTQISDRSTRKMLLDAMRKGIMDFDHSHIVMCFDPRHEIYAKRNGNSQRLTICFECNQVEAWGGKFQLADTPQPVFDRVLREAGVPLPEPSKK